MPLLKAIHFMMKLFGDNRQAGLYKPCLTIKGVKLLDRLKGENDFERAKLKMSNV